MALIFNDTLQATDGTGLYTLMTFVNGTWTDIHTVSGVTSGTIEVDAMLNTITVDTTLLNVGQTYQFKWVDSSGMQSNISTVTLPINITILIVVVNDTTLTITLDGTGSINWGDGSMPVNYNNVIATAENHNYTPGTYTVVLTDVSGLRNFSLIGNDKIYATSVDQLPDTEANIDLHGNRIGDTGLPNGPSPTGLITANLSDNMFSTTLVDQLFNQLAAYMPDIMVVNFAGQTPPAPPTSLSAAARTSLSARGVTVLHD